MKTLYTLLLSLPFLGAAQNPADELLRTKVWSIGFGSGSFEMDAPRLTFENGNVLVENINCRVGSEGISTANSSGGDLLAYGIWHGVFDSFNDTIPNSQDIDVYDSGVQSYLMLPKPDQNEFIGFAITTDGPITSLQWKYSELNLSGPPSIGVTNIELADNVLESMASVHHCNGKELWVVTHGINNANFYFSLLDSLGNVVEPTIQSIGSTFHFVQGSIKFSADGKKLAICSGQEIFHGGERALLDIYHFNNEQGYLFDKISLTTLLGVYSLSFSSDGKFLYAGTLNGELFQYNVEVWDSTAIENSRVLLAQNPLQPIGTMQNALDGKIYIAQGGAPQNDSLGIIHNPSIAGTGCGYEHSALNLGGTFCGSGLPNFPESYFNVDGEAYPCSLNSVGHLLSTGLQLNVYPIPSAGNVKIDIPSQISPSEINSIDVFDVLGRQVKTRFSITPTVLHLECLEPTAGQFYGQLNTNENQYTFTLTLNP